MSVLGPLIFLLSIESINYLSLDGNLGLFVDDTREGMAVANKNAAWKIQKDLDEIGRWSNFNNMKFNSRKFEVLETGYNHELKSE